MKWGAGHAFRQLIVNNLCLFIDLMIITMVWFELDGLGCYTSNMLQDAGNIQSFTTWKLQTLQWRHNDCDGVSTHLHLDCLLNCLFRRRSKKTSKLLVTCPCEGNSSVTGEFLAQWASNTENVFNWWCHLAGLCCYTSNMLQDVGNIQSFTPWAPFY